MKEFFGKYNGQDIYKFTLKNGQLEVDIITLGGTITDIRFPDKNGQTQSLIAGYKDVEGYLSCDDYRGAILGRVANRIENAKFILNGVEYNLTKNEGENAHHGGKEGFNKKVWEPVDFGNDYLTLFFASPDGDQGFPGRLETIVKYTLNADNSLRIDFNATSDKDTIINLSIHPYFSLNGRGENTDGIILFVDSDKITLNDQNNIPHGEFTDIKNTLYDFRLPKEINGDLSGDKVLYERGFYDNNFVLNGEGLSKAVEMQSKKTGISLQVITDQKGVQIYSGNPIGIAIETQNFPNSVNCKEYPSPILKANDSYNTTTIFAFNNKKD